MTYAFIRKDVKMKIVIYIFSFQKVQLITARAEFSGTLYLLELHCKDWIRYMSYFSELFGFVSEYRTVSALKSYLDLKKNNLKLCSSRHSGLKSLYQHIYS